MPVPPIPVSRLLVPPTKPAAPEGFTPLEAAITSGLPHVMPLSGELVLVLAVPTGLARAWREADPSAVVSHSDDQLAPQEEQLAERIATPWYAVAHLLLRRAGATVATVPLIAGMLMALPHAGDEQAAVEIEVLALAWDIRAGSLRGPGEWGSRISLAWRRADQGTPHFTTPAVNPYLLARLRPAYRMQSTLGLKQRPRTRRLRLLRVEERSVR